MIFFLIKQTVNSAMGWHFILAHFVPYTLSLQGGLQTPVILHRTIGYSE